MLLYVDKYDILKCLLLEEAILLLLPGQNGDSLNERVVEFNLCILFCVYGWLWLSARQIQIRFENSL